VYIWLRWLYDNNELLQFENGTTGIKNFGFTLFSATFKLVIPTPEVVKAFASLTSDFFHQQQVRASENETLAALRDALLPKLISGELRVRDVGRIVGGQP
jgi:type I restriction enzyme S subunit